MHAFVDRLVAIASDHALIAYGLGLVLAGAEALPVIGALVPGTAVIVTLAALIAAGALEFWPLTGAVVLGAVVGDGFGYWLGRRYKDAVFRLWPLGNHPELAERGAALFHRSSETSVFIGRFTPGVRAVVPLFAGILAMKPARFFLTDIAAAVLWAVSHILFGLFLGASLELLGAVAGRLAALALLLILLAYAVIWVSRWAMQSMPQALGRLAGPLAAWAARQPGGPQRLLARALATDRAEAFGLAAMAGLIVGGVWLLLVAVESVLAGRPIARLDGVVMIGLGSLHADWADMVMRIFAATGSGAALGLLGVGVFLVLATERQWMFVLSWIVGLAASLALGFLLSLLPHPLLPPATDLAGLPGHWDAMAAALAYGLVGLFITRASAPGLRPAIASGLSLVVVFGAAARLYLGFSVFSTEIIAIAFALAWLGLVGFAAQLRRPSPGRVLPIALVALTVLIVAVGAQAGGYDLVPPPVPPPPPPVLEMALTEWRDTGWASLPGSRIGLLGNLAQHFVLQWAGPLTELEHALATQGWQKPPPWGMQSALAWLAPTIDPQALPVLPRFADGRPEALVLTRLLPDNHVPPMRLVLRLWPSEAVIRGGDERLPLWLGVMSEERFVRIAGALTIIRSVRAAEAELAALAIHIPHAVEVRENMVPSRPGRPAAGVVVLLGWAGPPSGKSP
ncbi:MAG TPA: VTT domain-containing protein [Acetobacteraceae bacterium]|nr:VTT domain-containing protein [Acetobacteraceae bacterium]